jgi:predicted metal-dependent hydrolase
MFKNIKLSNYLITRSNRKTLCLLVNKNAELIVKAPHKISTSRIEEFIQKKQNWIDKIISQKKQKIQELEAQKNDLIKNKQIYILGKKVSKLKFEAEFLNILYSNEKLNFEDILVKKLEIILRERLNIYFPKLDFKSKTNIFLKIKKFKTKWGSCQKIGSSSKVKLQNSAKNNLVYSNQSNLSGEFLYLKQKKPLKINFFEKMQNFLEHKSKLLDLKIIEKSQISEENNYLLYFNLDLIHLPIKVIDYVVAHELTHIFKAGHKQDFWIELKKIYPDHKNTRKWLKHNYKLYLVLNN